MQQLFKKAFLSNSAKFVKPNHALATVAGSSLNY